MAPVNGTTSPMLRIVNAHDAAAPLLSRQRTTGRGGRFGAAGPVGPEIGSDSDSSIAATDPRWVFSVRVASMLEGGKAGVLRPERRDRLLSTAQRLGLRPFDAALIIAMVQDEARRSALPSGYPPLTQHLAASLNVVPKPTRTNAQVSILQRSAAATLIAACMVAAAIFWLNQG